jgi:prophage regulatory protein
MSEAPKPRPMSKIAAVQAKTLLSASSVYRLMSRGEFPQSVKLGDNLSAWLDEDVDRWLEDRIASRVSDHDRASAVQRERARRGKPRGRKKARVSVEA